MLRSVVVGVVTISLSGAASAQSMFATSDPVPETRTTVLAAAQPELPPNPVTGFIEFLFGEPARQAQRGSRQWFGAPPQQDYSRDEQDGRVAYANAPSDDQVLEPQRSDEPIDPRFLRQEVAYNGRKRPAPWSSIQPTIFCIWSGPGAGPFVTASVSPGRDFHGQDGMRFRQRKNGRTGFRPGKCSSASHTSRTLSLAVRKIRSGRARFISARASIASTVRMSLGQSARTYRQDASACAMRTSSTFTSA
jgi:hypothetical protein